MEASDAVSSTSAHNLGMRGDYQQPHSTMTLREGLAEYYRVNPGLSEPAKITDKKSAAYFHNHDCTHVVFGTHTGDLDEGVNDLFTLFGVDIRYRDYITGFFATAEGKSIAKHYAVLGLFLVVWRTLKLTPTIWRATRSMNKKWPWTPPEDYLDRSLKDLREEFGIEIFRPEVALGLAD